VVRSNRVEALAEVLAQDLRHAVQHATNPLEPDRIVVGSRGMERWLRHRLATELGVCANVEFPFPAAFLRSQVDHICGPSGLPESTPWSQEVLTLAIAEILGTEHRIEGPLADIEAARHTTAQQLSIADQVARVFDRYGIYRPALVRSWCGLPEHDPPRLPQQLEWQDLLWYELRSRMDPQQHFAVRTAHAVQRLAEGGIELDGPIRVFGFSSLPPAWLDLLSALSEHVDVSLFVLSPSGAGWDLIHAHAPEASRLLTLDRELELPLHLDLSQSHPLEESLGRAARDMQLVLESQRAYELDLPVDETQAEQEGEPCALHRLQADIFHSRTPPGGAQRTPLDPADRSIQFHACHGPARQVEVLRDVILGLLDESPDLEPRDIVVMTPDIATYAPLLQGTFQKGAWYRDARGLPWGESGTPRVPVEIADLSVRRVNPVADALLKLLEVADGRLTATSALDLLALEPVSERFGLKSEDIGQIREIVIHSGIRWGLDAEDRMRAQQTEDEINTFAFGLDRLALGVAMADDGTPVGLHPDEGEAASPLTPWDDAEHGETLDLLGHFFDYCSTLNETLYSMREARPLRDWVESLTRSESGILDQLTLTRGESQWLTQRVRAELERLLTQAQDADAHRPMGLDAIRTLLQGRFEVASSLTREQTGAVTCCAMLPMRTVPYRVVCLLGMDDGSFPRRGTLPGFDWTSIQPRAGDRVPRDEDRLLLLEAILSTRSNLVVLYTGQSVKTNEERQPCVPVAELRDALDQTFAAPQGDTLEWMTRAHTLHGFDPKNFRAQRGESASNRHHSFDPRLMAAAQAALKPKTDPPFLPSNTAKLLSTGEPESVTEIASLAHFLSNPVRSLVQHRLGLRLREYSVEVEDQLPVELTKREHRKIGEGLLSSVVDAMVDPKPGHTSTDAVETCMARTIDHLRGAGQLPPGNACSHVLASHRSAFERLTLEWGDLLSTPQTLTQVRIPFEINGQKVELTGQIPHIRGGTMLALCAEDDVTNGSMWWLITPWIHYLAWAAHDPAAAGHFGMIHVIHKDGGKLKYRLFDPAWPADERQERARSILHWMMKTYAAGKDSPIPLFPRASCQFAQGIQKHNKTASVPITAASFEQARAHPSSRDLEPALEKAREGWGSAHGWYGDAQDVHLAHVYGHSQPYLLDPLASPRRPHPDFAAASLHLWLPLLDCRNSGLRLAKFKKALLREESS
jgi:exodeoxyribonuclease V gamma subunit